MKAKFARTGCRDSLDGSGKERVVIAAWKAHRNATIAAIAREVGVNAAYASRKINLWKISERVMAGEFKDPPPPMPAPTIGALVRVTDLEVRRDCWQVQNWEANASANDQKALQGPGLTAYWDDGPLVGLLDGVVATIGGLFSELNGARSQLAWEIISRELCLNAAFCESSVLPVARRGIYRGLRGDEYFGRVCDYIRQKIALGPLGA